MSVSMVNTEGKNFENPAYEVPEDPATTGVMTITSAANNVSHPGRLFSYHAHCPRFMSTLNNLPCPPQAPARPPTGPMYIQAADEFRQKSLKAAREGKVCYLLACHEPGFFFPPK